MAKTKLKTLVQRARNEVHAGLQLWGDFPECSPGHACDVDWIHVLLTNTTDVIEHARLVSDPEHSERTERRLMRKKLARVIATCEAWDRNL